jgi:two-component system, chemotaxis family, protein-glutamate methylesterase/glutaminase
LEQRDLVVIGASAGGIEAVSQILAGLPERFPATLLVVIHIPSSSPGTLPLIFGRRTQLAVAHPVNRQRIETGAVYIAPPDRHLMVQDGHVRLVRGPRENRHRPAIDPLFRSAAVSHGERVIGVILTGALDDGSAGLRAIKERGGIAIVQDPEEAPYSSMPRSAMSATRVDHSLRLEALVDKLLELAGTEVEVTDRAEDALEREVRMVLMEDRPEDGERQPGMPSVFSCPDCKGVLWTVEEGDLQRYRCRVGHAFSPEAMIEAQSEVLEEALWSALKTLEETASLSRRLAEREERLGHQWLVTRFEERESEALRRAEAIRSILQDRRWSRTVEDQSS